VVTVLSTISGTPLSWAMLAMAAKSSTLFFGLPIVSVNTALVLASMAAATLAGLPVSTNFTSMPSAPGCSERGCRCRRRDTGGDDVVAGLGEVEDGQEMAAEPEAKASAPTPPSISARRFSSTSVVGFIMRV
jgi:hypothetical protein